MSWLFTAEMNPKFCFLQRHGGYGGWKVYGWRLDLHIVTMLISEQFINLVAGGGSEAQPSDYLESCTKDAVAAKPFLLDGRSVTLVDTPGFDPTDGNEAQVLRLISEVLVNRYAHRSR